MKREPLRPPFVVSIVGMGGLGKTVAAVSIVHREEVRCHFPDGVAFITVGERPSVEKLQRSVLFQLTGQDLAEGLD